MKISQLIIWKCQLLLAFSYLLPEGNSCSAELSMKKVLYPLGPSTFPLILHCFSLCSFLLVLLLPLIGKTQNDLGPKVIKLFSCWTQQKMKFSLLINMKMPMIVGIFKFISREFSCSAMFSKTEFAVVSNLRFFSRTNTMLSWVEQEKSFITLGPEWLTYC